MKGSLPCSSSQCFNGLRLTGTIPASNAGGAPDPPAVGSFSVGVVFLGLWLKKNLTARQQCRDPDMGRSRVLRLAQGRPGTFH